MQVAKLYLAQKNQREIAQELNISQQCVSNDLKAIREDWRAIAVQDFAKAVAEQLAKLRALEQEGWAAWEKSKAPGRSRTITTGEGTNRRGHKLQETQTSRCGDPAFLATVMNTLDKQARLLDLYGQKPTATTILPGLPDAHLDHILREHYAQD